MRLRIMYSRPVQRGAAIYIPGALIYSAGFNVNKN
jgi:hypothetical protein